MNDKKIEQKGCSALERLIEDNDFLDCQVQKNDKSVSYDGEIIIYNSENFKKSNLKDIIKVQVKGKSVNQLTKFGSIKYSLKKEDLEVYHKVGLGILFIVVEICKKTRKTKLFYNALAPLDVHSILIDIEKKGTITKRLEFFNLNHSNIYSVCFNQSNNVKKQPLHNLDLYKNKTYNKYEINSIFNTEGTNLFDSILKSNTYLYGIEDINNNEFPFPISNLSVESVKFSEKKFFVLENESLFVNYSIEKSNKEEIINIENWININSKNGKISEFKFGMADSISSYNRGIKFLKFLLIEKYSDFELVSIKLSNFEDKLYNDVINEVEACNELLECATKLGVSHDYKIKTKNIYKLLGNLVGLHTYYEKGIIPFESDNNSIIKIDLSGDKDYIILFKCHEGKIYNIFDNFVTSSMKVKIDDKNVSMYNTFFEESFIVNSLNFNLDIFLNDIIKNITIENSTLTLITYVNMIKLFEYTNNSLYFYIAKTIIEELFKFNNESTSKSLDIILEFFAFVSAYYHDITKDNRDFLINFLNNNNEINEVAKFYINTLLGYTYNIELIINTFSKESLDNFYKLPIYKVYLKYKK